MPFLMAALQPLASDTLRNAAQRPHWSSPATQPSRKSGPLRSTVQPWVVGNDQVCSPKRIIPVQVDALSGEIDSLIIPDSLFRRQAFLATLERALQSRLEGAVYPQGQVIEVAVSA